MLERIVEEYKLIQDELRKFSNVTKEIQKLFSYEVLFGSNTTVYMPQGSYYSTFDVATPNDTSSYFVPEQSVTNADYSGLLDYFSEQAELSDNFSAAVRTFDGKTHYIGDSLEDRVHLEKELDYVESRFNHYMENQNPSLLKYLESIGKEPVKIAGFASATMEKGVVGAMLSNIQNGIYISNDNYDKNIEMLAQSTGLNFSQAELLFWSHETIHAAGFLTEKETFKKQFEYFSSLAMTTNNDKERESYMQIAAAVNERYERERDGKEESN